jgi:hypothetical protein
MRPAAALLALPLVLAACGTTGGGEDADLAGLSWARLGQRVYVDGPAVTPLEVLEDSRCPAGARCAWAGQVRIRAIVHLGPGDVERELVTGKPVVVADGKLELVATRPVAIRDKAILAEDYRFGLRFSGGL